ncbi:DegT/DnrJ/EryC1/StrS family aminotransferase, partial [Paraglaciecola sp.]
DPEMVQRARILRDHGMSPNKRYWHDYAGFNFRMTNMQAAIGVAQMDRIDELLSRKKAIFKTYDSYLSKTEGVSLLPKNPWSENSYWLYTLVIDGYGSAVRDQLISNLEYRGLDARPGFYPMHQMEPYQEFGHGAYPVSSYLSANSVSLPCSIGLANEEVTHIVEIFIDELSKFPRDNRASTLNE